MTEIDSWLKPCPFCGESAKIDISDSPHDNSSYFVQCMTCYARSAYYSGYECGCDAEQKAINAWNRRNGKHD